LTRNRCVFHQNPRRESGDESTVACQWSSTSPFQTHPPSLPRTSVRGSDAAPAPIIPTARRNVGRIAPVVRSSPDNNAAGTSPPGNPDTAATASPRPSAVPTTLVARWVCLESGRPPLTTQLPRRGPPHPTATARPVITRPASSWLSAPPSAATCSRRKYKNCPPHPGTPRTRGTAADRSPPACRT